MLECIVSLLLIGDVLLLLLDVVLDLLDMIVLARQIRLKVLLILKHVRVLHKRVLLGELVLKVLKEAVIQFLKVKHVLVIVWQGDAFSDHYAQR